MPLSIHSKSVIFLLSYSMVVLYIRDYRVLGIFPFNHPKNNLSFPPKQRGSIGLSPKMPSEQPNLVLWNLKVFHLTEVSTN